jgi:glycerol dehydrogenase
MKVGLPVCLADIGIENISEDELKAVAEKSCIAEESIHSMPFPITVANVSSAIMVADRIGKDYKNRKVYK